ncbi:MAG: hypothetical protein CTY35_00475 [Methylotenera sp.]|uniref:hypothetical protein n=1 Tax=Methylotenera sp. TaxID=2051956 RepID=UPI000D4B5BB0|nr:hypothetical protein [Methylotenera sp.]PPC84830.1 MAG: hypothetical protein CTY38_00470 [Methylotenera sp.]PPD02190.1 MAG: hypothetical protein CTY35_00475 [Methylotenera sp.]
MKIGIYELYAQEGDDSSHVSSVVVEQQGDECEIVINTVERWAGVRYQGASFNMEARDLLDSSVGSISFIVDPANSSTRDDAGELMNTHQTEVIIFAENEEEAKLISGIKYTLQEKDQIIFLIKPYELKPRTTLATTKIKSPKPPTP